MMNDERQHLINEAAPILGNIKQLYMDAAYWNDTTRPRLYPDADPINPDPDGQMARWKLNLESMLRREAELGRFPNYESEAP